MGDSLWSDAGIILTVVDGLAFKSRDIEESVDVYFFRRLGIVFALAARAIGMSPTGVTVVAMIAGGVGGALLAWPDYAMLGVALLVLHGVLDSSDGQLARLTGNSTEFGRMMDGVAGYVTHIAMYLGILASGLSRGWGWELAGLMLVAGVSTIVHAQMYDYHRSAYVAYVTKGEPPPAVVGAPNTGIVGAYEAMQRVIVGLHPEVERVLVSRLVDGRVGEADRQRYRACFHTPIVYGWNLMGDNMRRLSILVAVWFGRPEWFIFVEIVPLNLLMVALWFRQREADRRFLEAA